MTRPPRSPLQRFRLVVGTVGIAVVAAAALVFAGHSWALGPLVVVWIGFLCWSFGFRCPACAERYLSETDGLLVHPRWMPRRCRKCGCPTDEPWADREHRDRPMRFNATCTVLLAGACALGPAGPVAAQERTVTTADAISLAPSPGSAPSLAVAPLVVSEPLERSAAWTKLRNWLGEGWVPTDALVFPDSLPPLDRWQGPTKIVVGDGDYDATYTVKADGTFRVRETASDGSDGYKQVVRSGRMRSNGRVVWAAVAGEPMKAERLFLRVSNARLCWSGYLDGRCP